MYAFGRPEQHQPLPCQAGASLAASATGGWPSSIAPASTVADAARLAAACSAVCGTTCTRVISPAHIPHTGGSGDALPSNACPPTLKRSSSGATPRCSPIASRQPYCAHDPGDLM